LIAAEQFKQAVEVLDHAVRAAPKNSRSFNARGFARLRMGSFEEALEDFDAALALDPGYANALHNRSVAKRLTEERRRFAAPILPPR
jgi:Flp pilus assembly protein TadD